MDNLHALSIGNFKAIADAYEKDKHNIRSNWWSIYIPLPSLEQHFVSASTEEVTRQPFAKLTFVRDSKYDWVLESITEHK